ncbi:MAG: restriction endonuclease subunit S, partial [Vicingaceae bacterium]
IKAEKEALIKAKTIKKEKPIPAITEDEMPYELPESWVWVKLGDLLAMYNGRAFKTTEWSESGLPIIRIQNLNTKNAPFNHFNGVIEERHRIKKGAFLISWSGTPGTSFGAFIWNGVEGALNQHINKCEFYSSYQNEEYMLNAINSQLYKLIEQAQGGAGLKHVTK